MANWEIQSSYSGADVTVEMTWRNVIGAPVHSVTKLDFGTAGALPCLPGVYRFKHVTPTTVSVRQIHSDDALNPYFYSGALTVVCDGATSNLNIMPGYAVIFHSDAATDNEFEIGVGCYWDSTNGVWFRMMPVGQKLAGFYDTERSLVAKNATGYVQTNSRLVATNLIRVVNGISAARPFLSFGQTGETNPTAHDDLDGVAITFDNYAAGSPSVVDILMGGAAIDCYNITEDVAVPGGAGLKCDGTTIYKFADATAYQSGMFVLSASLAETDTATIYVSDGGEFVQIATATDDFVDGSTGIDLTDSDEVTGQVGINEEVTFRMQFGGPSDADIDLNMRGFSLRIVSETV